MSDAGDRAAVLEAEIRRHNRLYFELAAPEIEDDAFDRLVEELKALRPDSSVLEEIGAPRPPARAASPDDAGDAWVHAVPMLSLDKCYDEPTLARWAAKFTGRVLASPKIDGVAMAIHYDAGGALRVAATRGDGVRGEVATAQIRGVADIPARAAPGVEVRGEVYMPLSTFHERFAPRGFANPRNTAAGALKQKDAARVPEHGLRFFAYDVLGVALPTEEAKMAWLADAGFTPAPPEVVAKADMQAVYEAWERRRDGADYAIDGVVFKVDDVAQQASMGRTGHHPRHAVAYKLKTESRVARLVRVLWSVSRTGAVTPVAEIEPTSLSGVTVTRVSMHNWGVVRKLGVTSDCTVRVTRRGGVIPHIEEVVAARGAPVVPPATCPECGAATQIDGDFVACTHDGCRTRRIGVLEHYAKVVGVDGFGPAVLEQAFDRGLLRDVDDLYRLTAPALVPLERMGARSAGNLVAAVQAARIQPLRTFLVSLGIPEVGPAVAAALERRFRRLEDVMAATEEGLAEVDGVGPVIAGHVVRAWRDQGPRISRLLEQVTVLPAAPEPDAPVQGGLAGRSFVFTGTLRSSDRAAAQARVRALGGLTPSGVTRDLTYLVAGDEGRKGGKLAKAEALRAAGAPVRVIDEAEFLALCDGAPEYGGKADNPIQLVLAGVAEDGPAKGRQG